MSLLQHIWYGNSVWSYCLAPLSWLYGAVVTARRKYYRRQTAQGQQWSAPVPIIIVGNISVGGVGKTPVVLALVELLRARGHKPGVVARGYGGSAPYYPLQVQPDTPAQHSGDEPLLICLRAGCPVVVAPDRVAAAQQLLQAHPDCSVIISDDGLQHYALPRDIEVAVVETERGLGNSRLLPAGPLREAPQRLAEVDWVLLNGKQAWQVPAGIKQSGRLQLRPAAWVHISSGRRVALADFTVTGRVCALAGIGNPKRFFNTLADLGITPATCIPFADHHSFTTADIMPAGFDTVLMTEKDAVKCRNLVDHRHWYLQVDCPLPAAFSTFVINRLAQL